MVLEAKIDMEQRAHQAKFTAVSKLPFVHRTFALSTLSVFFLWAISHASLPGVDALALTAEIDRLEQTAADEQAAHLAAQQQRAAGLNALMVQRDQQRRELAALQQQVVALEQQLSADPLAEQIAALEEAEAMVVAELSQALQHLSLQCVPGVVPVADPTLDPVADVLRRWDIVQRELQRVALRVQTGTLATNKQEIAAQILVFGGVSALWLSLDGSDGGLVQSSSGDNSASTLEFISLPTVLPALRAALAQHAGQAPASWVWLPITEPRATQEGAP